MADDNVTTRIDEARHHWGLIFNDFRLACEWNNSAWYQAKDKSMLKKEIVQRFQSLIKYCQKEIDTWEARDSAMKGQE